MSLKKKLLITAAVIFLLLICVFIFRFSILRMFSNNLVDTDETTPCELVVILSGGAYDRGNEAAKLYQQKISNRFLCIGGNHSGDLRAAGFDYFESDVTKMNLQRNHVPDSLITVVHVGTSTLEEADEVLKYCNTNHLKKIMVVSSSFHTHRVQNVYHKKFKNSGIEFLVHAAPSSSYKETEWWKTEDGLLALANEYIKLVYYFLKK